MSKTIREYLEELPEPYRTQALGQTDNPELRKVYITDLESALHWAFNWEQSKQGFDYWFDIMIDERRQIEVIVTVNKILNK